MFFIVTLSLPFYGERQERFEQSLKASLLDRDKEQVSIASLPRLVTITYPLTHPNDMLGMEALLPGYIRNAVGSESVEHPVKIRSVIVFPEREVI